MLKIQWWKIYRNVWYVLILEDYLQIWDTTSVVKTLELWCIRLSPDQETVSSFGDKNGACMICPTMDSRFQIFKKCFKSWWFYCKLPYEFSSWMHQHESECNIAALNFLVMSADRETEFWQLMQKYVGVYGNVMSPFLRIIPSCTC